MQEIFDNQINMRRIIAVISIIKLGNATKSRGEDFFQMTHIFENPFWKKPGFFSLPPAIPDTTGGQGEALGLRIDALMALPIKSRSRVTVVGDSAVSGFDPPPPPTADG